MRTTRALSWYLHRRCKMPLNSEVTPVSAKIRAINSSLPVDADDIADTAVAVTFCNRLGSNPCCESDTPVRLAWMLSKYSNIGKDCPAEDCTVIGTIAFGFFIRITPPAVDVSKSSRLTCPSTAPTL